MPFATVSRIALRSSGASALALLALLALPTATARAASPAAAPALLARGQNLGLESPSMPLHLTVWLNGHRKSELDARVAELYTPGSKTFHQWLSVDDLKAYAPAAAEVATVQKELAAHGLAATEGDPLGFSLRVTGTVAQVESAFGVSIAKYALGGKTVHVSSAEPRLGGAAAALVHGVGGLNSGHGEPLVRRASNPATGVPYAGVPLSKAGPNGQVYAGQCFYNPSTTELTGVNYLDGTTPVTTTVTGLNYGADPSNTADGTLAPCGYSVAQMQGFYGLPTAYGRGYTGAGQTVVVVESGTNAQTLGDANAFSTREGLPALSSANYEELNPYNVVITAGSLGVQYVVEADLDVEWAHAVAPGAKIVLIDTQGDEEDIQGGILYAVENHLGNTISLSYGNSEYFTGEFATEMFGEVAEMAAAAGVALNVSSGDDGDFTDVGTPAPDTNAWGDSPWATSVGGTSLGTDPNTGAVYQTGWGTNVGYLTAGQGLLFDPPNALNFFYAGSGGGASQYWAKPAFESALPGNKRLVPDVSALADPETGVEIVYTDPASGEQMVGIEGGTSLATPIISGIWALLNQYAGSPLGQVAPYVAQSGSPFVTDIQPLSAPDNISATVTDPQGTSTYSPAELAQPLSGQADFVVALWKSDNLGDYLILSFGTDSSLQVAPGWDDVTGWGTPNVGAIFSALP